MIRKPAIIVSLFAALAAGAAVYPIDSCRSARNWVFIDGAEFGGARGGVAEAPADSPSNMTSPAGALMSGCAPAFPLPDLPEYRITVAADRESSVNYRLTDANGRTFQGVPVTVRPGRRYRADRLRCRPVVRRLGRQGGCLRLHSAGRRTLADRREAGCRTLRRHAAREIAGRGE